MAKSKAKNKNQNKESVARANVKSTKTYNLTLTELRDNGDLWYKVRVLIYDLQNMNKDKACENRTLQTTNPLYISAPYFSPEEAAAVKSTVVDTNESAGTTTTLEQAISSNLENFLTKRRPSRDCRPCGPHDMVPVYLSCFGIDKADIADEKFVSRLRRAGLRTT